MEDIHKQLKDILKVIDASELQYWACGGTLLGAVRHKDFIPWDDDADIDMLDTIENHEKILYLEPYLNYLGYGLIPMYYGYKIFSLSGTEIKKDCWREHKRVFKELHPLLDRPKIAKGASKTYVKPKTTQYHKYKYPYFDIFLVSEVGNKIIYNDASNKKFWYKKDELFPLKKAQFGDMQIPIPNNPLPHLFRGYGKDCLTTGKIYYDHKNEKIIPLKVFPL